MCRIRLKTERQNFPCGRHRPRNLKQADLFGSIGRKELDQPRLRISPTMRLGELPRIITKRSHATNIITRPCAPYIRVSLRMCGCARSAQAPLRKSLRRSFLLYLRPELVRNALAPPDHPRFRAVHQHFRRAAARGVIRSQHRAVRAHVENRQ